MKLRLLDRFKINKITKLCCICMLFCSVIAQPFVVYADVDYMAEWENRKSLPVESNEVMDWPEGPAIGAGSAILMEMNTHTILYSKNIHEQMYPASITKIMTSLLAYENCNLNDTVTFSYNAVHDVPYDGANMGMDTGEALSLEQALYGVLVKSANETASAVGEHVAASLGKEASAAGFAEIMNARAEELGCLNTHFANANGLFDENHYTTAYDMALIACEFFSHSLLCQMSSTTTYHIEPTELQPDDFWISSKNQLLKGREHEYEYLLGSKTGYLDSSRQTLVSAAEKNGMKLVCVVFQEESPYQFEDTISLFNYGFENFQKLMVEDYETKYSLNNFDLFETESDLFGSSGSLMELASNAYVVVPNSAVFDDLDSSLNYEDTANPNTIATIEYQLNGINVGTCDISYRTSKAETFNFYNSLPENEEIVSTTESSEVIFVNIKKIIIGIVIVAFALVLIFSIISFVNSYNFSPKRREIKQRRQKRNREARIAARTARKNAALHRKHMRRRRSDYKRRKRNRPIHKR